MHAMSFVFIGIKIPHRCFVDEFDGNGTVSYDHQAVWNSSIPFDSNGEISQCKRFSPGSNKSEIESCNKWVFDTSKYSSSVRIDYSLVCDRSILAAVAQSVYMAGMLIGAVLLGELSDKFGRRKLLLISIVLQLISGIGLAFAPEYFSFIFFRFLLGNAHSGVFLPGFTLGMEFVGPKGQVGAGISPHMYFGMGFCVISLLAYFIKSWKWLQLAITLPALLFASYYWLIPESARWLLRKNRKEEAKVVLRNAAKINRVTIPDIILETTEKEVEGPKENFIHIFRYKFMRRNALIVFYDWFVVSLVFYGLSFGSASLPGGLYFNVALSGLVELPGAIYCWVFMDRLGRRFTLSCAMLITGCCCIGTIFIGSNTEYWWISAILSNIGKAFVSAGFILVYQYSAELFPTLVRNSAVGFSSMCARIGGVITPFINFMGYLHPAVPAGTFGGLALIAGLLTIILPETLNRPLPESLDEGEQLNRVWKMYKPVPTSEQEADDNNDDDELYKRKMASLNNDTNSTSTI
ncbi:unnamed protein product [Owenia fusiformis]|uniref:Major facilitator superfamily (MFS) profile domain-containing protein n=1 Tax=Owenia fusiformis TaxID=6347 RepID=A0A8S4NAP3_OWEFU|nr:unnamed protein product [Owenia fusiformis]